MATDNLYCNQGRHSWSQWVGYDSFVIEAGMTEGYRYHRECRISGCEAKEKAKDLEPAQPDEDDARSAVALLMRDEGSMPPGTYLKCVFCESPTARTQVDNSVPSLTRSFVECYACLARGPAKQWPKDAIDAWVKHGDKKA